MSAPSSPGEVSRVSDSRIRGNDRQAPPLALQCDAIAGARDRAPCRRACPDIAATRRARRPCRARVRGSPTTSAQPSGAARVRITASVCGCTSLIDEEYAFALTDAEWRSASAIASAAAVAFVEQRGVGDVEPGEVADHGLEVEQGFEPALADLRLIRRVRRVPGRVLQDVALDHRRQDGAGIALADQRREYLVAARRCSLICASASVLAQRVFRDRAAPSGGSTRAASHSSAPAGSRRRPSPASR